jgi:hypothetical protein
MQSKSDFIIDPQRLADPAEFEKYIEHTRALCPEREAGTNENSGKYFKFGLYQARPVIRTRHEGTRNQERYLAAIEIVPGPDGDSLLQEAVITWEQARDTNRQLANVTGLDGSGNPRTGKYYILKQA